MAWLISLFVEFFSYTFPSAQAWIKSRFIEWFLPDHVVLKMQKNPQRQQPEYEGGDDEVATMAELFDTEAKVYEQLKPLYGVVIPRCYGQLRYQGSRALMLEYLAGSVSLVSPEGATLTLSELSHLLQPCYRALHAFGVHHQDPQLGNFHLVQGGRIMILDFERAAWNLSAEERDFFMRTNIWDLAERYRDAQAYYRREGLLEAA